ncbi:unnamed protein product [Lampetra planeri]
MTRKAGMEEEEKSVSAGGCWEKRWMLITDKQDDDERSEQQQQGGDARCPRLCVSAATTLEPAGSRSAARGAPRRASPRGPPRRGLHQAPGVTAATAAWGGGGWAGAIAARSKRCRLEASESGSHLPEEEVPTSAEPSEREAATSGR